MLLKGLIELRPTVVFLAYSCNCKSTLRVIQNDLQVVVEIEEEHNADSHSNDTYRKLKFMQEAAMFKIVRAYSSLSAIAVQ